jgi:hypothetical protein
MMNLFFDYLQELKQAAFGGWDRFWFTPDSGQTLALIRVLAGAMLLYTHAVWSLDLAGFFSNTGRISSEFADLFHDHPMAWSYLSAIQPPALLWATHLAALAVFLLLMLGLWTRVVSVLAFLIAISYVHRAPAALFGLDQINCLLAFYLAVGDAGAHFSIDSFLRQRQGRPIKPAISSNIAIRLIQCHMCVIYLFAAMGKLQGSTWWEGSAMWLALANLEYQSIDMTWLARWPRLIEFMSQVTIAWELSYIVLIWNRWTRPLVLALAIPLHLGIAFCMGMITFGLIMLVGNLAFVPASVVTAFWPGANNRTGAPE